jgi:hypothetical protein
MQIMMRSMVSGKHNTRDIPITQAQLDAWQQPGVLIQDALPHLSLDDREFLMTGITPEEWDEHFSEED